MNALADALVLAVAHINCRGDEEDDERLDADVTALEGIAACLRTTTAAERALSAERASLRPNHKMMHDFARWMEEMFVEGWEGNRRTPA